MAYISPDFHLSQESIDARTHVIHVRGEIHVSTAPEFSECLNQALADGKTAVVLDLSEVEFIDSTGLSVLLNGLRRVIRRQGSLVLACSNPTVLRLFQITRLDGTFDIQPTREQALARVQLQDGDGAGSSDGAP